MAMADKRTTVTEEAHTELDQAAESLDLYRFADEESIDWGQEGNQTLAMLYESEAILLDGGGRE